MFRASRRKKQDTTHKITTQTNIVPNEVMKAEMDLIRNFHIQYVRPCCNFAGNIDMKYEKVPHIFRCLPDAMAMSRSQLVRDLVF
jgi:hypothetical protein